MFDGHTYEPAHDEARLTSQLMRVQTLMRDGRWRTLDNIQEAIGGSLPGVSARLRDLRKTKFGGYTVQRRRVGGGLFEYRVVIE